MVYMKIYDKKLLLIALICLIGTVWQGWYLMQNRGKFDFVLLIMFILGVCIYLRGALTKQGYEEFQRQRAKEKCLMRKPAYRIWTCFFWSGLGWMVFSGVVVMNIWNHVNLGLGFFVLGLVLWGVSAVALRMHRNLE